MTEPAQADAPAVDAPTSPAAELDRRFYAFALDRVLGWSLYAAAAWVAWTLLLDRDRVWAGIGVLVATVVLLGLASAALLGLTGLSPGKALLGLRAVHHARGTPIGVGRAVLRGVILGAATLPTFGLGVATLAWTSVMDPRRHRRGWHDQVARSIVVDVRPAPVEDTSFDGAPRHLVNLTAMRLVPTMLVPESPAVPAPPVRRALLPPPASAPVPVQGSSRQLVQPNLTRAPVPTVPSGSATAPERTVVRRSARAGGLRWRVSFDTGDSFLVEGLGIVGRGPEARPGEPVRHVVPLPSTDMSLSKTHAQFHLALDGVLVVMDRGSTNGSVLIRRGVVRDLPAGRPATLLDGDRVRLGDREMIVSREV